MSLWMPLSAWCLKDSNLTKCNSPAPLATRLPLAPLDEVAAEWQKDLTMQDQEMRLELLDEPGVSGPDVGLQLKANALVPPLPKTCGQGARVELQAASCWC